MNDLDKKRDEWILQEYGTGHDRESHFVIDTAKNGWSAAVKEMEYEIEAKVEEHAIKIQRLLRLVRTNSENWGDELGRLREVEQKQYYLKQQIKDYEAALLFTKEKTKRDPLCVAELNCRAARVYEEVTKALDKYSKKEGE